DEDLDGVIAGSVPRRYTPVSDFLWTALREVMRYQLPDDVDYTEKFDRLEFLLALLAMDTELVGKSSQLWLPGPWYGSFTWRDRSSRPTLEERIHSEYQNLGEQWPPMLAGFFDGSPERAEVAFDSLLEEIAKVR